MSRTTGSEVGANIREALERVKGGEEIENSRDRELVAVWSHSSKQ